MYTLISVLMTILFCASYSTTAFPSTTNGTINSLFTLFPKDKIEAISEKHLKTDEGFKSAVLYLQGKEWSATVDAVLKKPEYKKFVDLAAEFKFNVSQMIHCIEKYMMSLKVEGKPTAKADLGPYVKDVEKIIPLLEMAKVLAPKQGDPEIKKLREKLASKESQKIAHELHNLPEMILMREKLYEMNFDVEPYVALVYTVLGWSPPPPPPAK